MTALTRIELTELRQWEAVIQDGLRTFTDVGHALMVIRDRRLYREEHSTFEAYCRSRWTISRPHAYRLIAAAEVERNLSPTGDTPANERQARALAKLPDAQSQIEVWQQAREESNGKPTAERIDQLTRKALAAMTPEEQLEVIDGAEEAVRRIAQSGNPSGGLETRLTSAANHLQKALKIYNSVDSVPAKQVVAAIDNALQLSQTIHRTA